MTIKIELNDAAPESAYDSVTFEGRISRKVQRIEKLNCDVESRLSAAKSYTESNETEKICGAIVSDFVKRFNETHPELQSHRPLFITADNEFGVPKCVCSTLKSTLLPYPSIHDSFECSRFVANYFDYEPLEDQYQPPKYLPSPTQVLRWGVGDCFDLSIILASFLTGAGYDAYVVYGTAPKWLCDRNRSMPQTLFGENALPHSDTEQQMILNALEDLCSVSWEGGNRNDDKDHVSRDFENVTRDIIPNVIQSSQSNASNRNRIHSWVLIKPNLRCPTGSTDYFIEPSSGQHYSPLSCPYNSIRAIWNSKNYWVCTKVQSIQNMQLTGDGGWESVFLNKDKGNWKKGNGSRMPFDPPFSWVNRLSIPENSFNFKYPDEGRRVICHDQHKVEMFSEGTQKNGVIRRLTLFEDKKMLIPIQCVEYFGNFRKDCLTRRIKVPQKHCFHESYSPLNHFSIKEWLEQSGQGRQINFHSKGRPDSLNSFREIFGKCVTHTYQERRDRLHERIIDIIWVDTAKTKMRERLVIPSGDGAQNVLVTKITERYKKPIKCCDQSLHVASRTLYMKGKVLETQYFSPDGGIEKKEIVRSKHKDHSAMITDDDDLINHQRMNNAEKEMITAVRNLHLEILDLSRVRKRDEAPFRIDQSSESDVKRVVARPKTSRTNEANESENVAIDYLSPYLVYVEDVNNITKEEALNMRTSCLTTMKERLLERANIIQNRLNEEQDKLAQIQASYQQKVENNSVSEKEFEKVCGDIVFKIKILERRIQEHEDSSLDKLKTLEIKLRDDERLKILLTDE